MPAATPFHTLCFTSTNGSSLGLQLTSRLKPRHPPALCARSCVAGKRIWICESDVCVGTQHRHVPYSWQGTKESPDRQPRVRVPRPRTPGPAGSAGEQRCVQRQKTHRLVIFSAKRELPPAPHAGDPRSGRPQRRLRRRGSGRQWARALPPRTGPSRRWRMRGALRGPGRRLRRCRRGRAGGAMAGAGAGRARGRGR